MIPAELYCEWGEVKKNVAVGEPGEEVEPIWVDLPTLTLRWKCAPDDMDYRENYQTAYRTAIYRSGECLWESGKVETYEEQCLVENPPIYMDDDMEDTFWTVTLWDMNFSLTETASGTIPKVETHEE